MSEVLYRKYRSKSLDQIIGQDHITKILKNAIDKKRLSHAYLFTGPRGVGKTSIARILAHQINEIPYIDDQSNIDIIEIDAASNRRIDEIRDLKDKVNILPSQLRYKIYIIDEVHMLTKEAFNALLKTLEEPPAHVIFILATTEYYKLPETIISRTQRFNFRPIPESLIFDHLKDISKLEKMNIDDEALKIIANHGQASFRDSISLLDQFSSMSNKITAEDVISLLGVPTAEQINKLIDLLENPKSTYLDLSNEIRKMYEQGQNAKIIAKDLMEQLRQRLISNKLTLKKELVFDLLNDLLGVNSSLDSDDYLELILLKTIHPQEFVTQPDNQFPHDSRTLKSIKRQPKIEISEKQPQTTKLNQETWDRLLDELKKEHNTLYGILMMAKTQFVNNDIYLTFKFDFHQKRINDLKNKQIISQIIKKITNQDFSLKTAVDKTLKLPEKDRDLNKINDLFGQAQVLNIE